jgi:hypothetical protein
MDILVSQFVLVQILKEHLPIIHFNIIHPCPSWSSKWSRSNELHYQKSASISSFFYFGSMSTRQGFSESPIAMTKFGTKCLMLLDVSVALKVVRQMEGLTMCSNSTCNCPIICCRKNCLIILLISLMSPPVIKTSLIKYGNYLQKHIFGFNILTFITQQLIIFP